MTRPAIFLAALLALAAHASYSKTQVVAVVSNRIVIDPLEKPVVLTGDYPRKMLPVWSPGGTEIAFIETAPEHTALALLVVITSSGALVATIPIEPQRTRFRYPGMRFVESAEWVTPTTILVGGSLNPSQSQYYLVHLRGGAQPIGFVDDRSSPSVSPDGLHYAAVVGIPHFGKPDYGQPELLVDGRREFAPQGSPVFFGDGPTWSPGSRGVALLVALPGPPHEALFD